MKNLKVMYGATRRTDGYTDDLQEVKEESLWLSGRQKVVFNFAYFDYNVEKSRIMQNVLYIVSSIAETQ